MKINRIVIDGFRNLSRTEILINKINGIVSINNYGKSNLLSGIKFGLNFISDNLDNKKNKMMQQNNIPINKGFLGKDFEFEVELEDTLNEKKVEVIYNYKFEWFITEDRPNKIKEEYLKIKNDETQKFTLIMQRKNNNGLYKSTVAGRCDKKISINDDSLLINKLLAYDNLYYIDLLRSICRDNMYIDRHFDSSLFYGINALIDKNEDLLSPTYGENSGIARVLAKLKKEDEGKYNLIINTFMSFFPEITNILIEDIQLNSTKKFTKMPKSFPFEFADHAYLLYVVDKYLEKPIRFSTMSDGAKRILVTLTSVILADRNNIPLIAIEEPENSIHPSLLRKYLDVLKQLAVNSQIILTSHSPNLVNYINLTDLYLGVPNKKGLAIFKKIKKIYTNRINNLADDMGKMSGEYLFELMSSGDEEDLRELMKYVNYE